MKKWMRENGLSIAFFLLFVIAIIGQIFSGYKEHNEELSEEGASEISVLQYLTSGHFIQSTFENWESEFLQMALFVILTIGLRQKGSSESKDIDKPEEVDKEPTPHANAPWPVKKGGIWITLYKNSLTYALLLLFLISFGLHFYGSLKDENTMKSLKGLPTQTASEYITSSRFWFESFQNWQSEFMSVFAIVILSIFLRQKGSPQSKPADVPDSETGK